MQVCSCFLGMTAAGSARPCRSGMILGAVSCGVRAHCKRLYAPASVAVVSRCARVFRVGVCVCHRHRHRPAHPRVYLYVYVSLNVECVRCREHCGVVVLQQFVTAFDEHHRCACVIQSLYRGFAARQLASAALDWLVFNILDNDKEHVRGALV